jgi:spermidine synthase
MGLFVPLLLLFAGSGCAALIYEIVWFQLLQLVIGSTAVSLGLLLAAYMGGLCLGSLLLPRFVPSRLHPLRIYALLELGIGILGILALFVTPALGHTWFPRLLSALSLLPATILMGASLPALSRLCKSSAALGYLYSANIAGAVFGCLFAGFYLLRVYDMGVASYTAAAMNLTVAAGSLLLSRSPAPSRKPPSWTETCKTPLGRTTVPVVYLAIALSGLSALGAEVVWTRLLSLLLGATVYTFSIILAVFLIGLWLGSTAGSALTKRTQNPGLAFAACQILLAAWIAWTAYTLAHSLPYWPVDPWLSTDPWFNFELDLVRCTWAIFPATLFWGASFPLALAAAAPAHVDPAQLSGRIYAANTAGSIVGALAFSLLLIPAIGTAHCEQVLIALAALAAAVALPRLVPISLALLIACTLILTVSDVPWQVIAYGRRMAPILRGAQLYDQNYPTTILYRGEGINSSVLIAERAGQRHFYVSGKAEASTAPLDMRLERMMGHIPALIHPNPKSILVVGFGAGITAGSFVPYPDVESITICELEPLIPPASTRFFGKQNYNVLHDRRTRIVYDDARHYIYTTPNRFDVITTDPIHPWVKGTSTLYSKEYYELVKTHLRPGGVVAQWLPIYDSDAETVKTELATFFDVFPNGTIWSNYQKGDGYDLVLLGQTETNPISVDQMQQRLDRPDYAAVQASLNEVGFHSAVEFLATYAGRSSDLAPYLIGAQINNDLNLRLQYLAGLGLNSMAAPQISREILTYRRFPADLLTGSGGRLDALHTLLPTGR